MKNYYKTPEKSIKKYFKKNYSRDNKVKENRKEINDKRKYYALTHRKIEKDKIQACKKCKSNNVGFCEEYKKWCWYVNKECIKIK